MNLNIFDISRQPFEYEEVRSACLIEEIVEETVNELSIDDTLGECITTLGGDMNLDTLLEQAYALLDSATTRENVIGGATEPSSPNPSSLVAELVKQELKPLSKTLKNKYLDPTESLPVIIAAELDEAQEQELLNMLREHKEGIRWSIGDTKGISLVVVMHKIHLEENAKTSWEPQ